MLGQGLLGAENTQNNKHQMLWGKIVSHKKLKIQKP